MAVIQVKNTEGTEVASISADSIEAKYDVTLVGENVENFIVEMDNNFVKLLENFSGETQPPKAAIAGGSVVGQVWYNKSNNTINHKTSSGWMSNADRLSGKKLDSIREFVLAGVDTTGKLSKTGGTITGEININGAVQVSKSVIPDTCDTISLGGPNNTFRDVYLGEDGIRLGPESKALTFRPHNFVYAVASDDTDVSKFPKGAIILHQDSGEAIIKKSTGTFGKTNNTFRKLCDDKQNSASIGGNRYLFLGDIGLVAGGWSPSQGWNTTSIDKIIISTIGNSSNFGNLSYGRSHMGTSMSSGARGVFQGGWAGGHGVHNGKMDYVTFATPDNATYFGTLGYENYGSSCVSDGTRGVIGPGYNATGTGPSGHHSTAAYITIETPGNASSFGSINTGYWGHAVSSGTRGVFGGYHTSKGWSGYLEYITIQTPRNGIDFGYTNRVLGHSPNTVTDAIKGVYFGGHNQYTYIEYITIATPSNGSDFGTCGYTTLGGGVSNGIIGVSTHIHWSTTSQYVVIQTLSNAINFGTLVTQRSVRPGCASGW